jgi:ribose transport system substrate-binding protein
MKRIARRVLALSALALPCCVASPEEPKPAVSVAWISKGRCNSFFDMSRFGVRLAARDLAARDEASVSVEMFEPDDCEMPAAEPSSEPCAKAAAQMAEVQAVIDKHVDAIAITVVDPACLTPLLDQAVAQGIKVLTFDSDAPDSQRQVYYGMDNRAAGHLIVQALADLLGESGKVAIQTAMSKDAEGTYQLSTSSSYVERMAGVQEELANHPELTLAATLPCAGNDPVDPACATEVETLVGSEPDLAGLLLVRGKLLREVDLPANAPNLTSVVESGRLRAVAIDAPDDALENLRSGYADVAIAQKQFGWGYDVATLAYEMVLHGATPPAFFDSGWYVVCPNNIDQYQGMWDSHDFRAQLAPCDLLK